MNEPAISNDAPCVARFSSEPRISWSISAVISIASAAMISASISRPCIAFASCAASKVQRADSLRVFASTVCFRTWIDIRLPAVPSIDAVDSGAFEPSPEYDFAISNGDSASEPAVVEPALSA